MIKSNQIKNEKNDIDISLICLSKTVQQINSSALSGLPVEVHCKIAGLVAQEIVQLYPEKISNALFPKGFDFLAACHDVGKISPDFQAMIYSYVGDFNIKSWPELLGANPDGAGRKEFAFHAKVSQATFEKESSAFANILALHHGFRPNANKYFEDAYGGEAWTRKRHNLVASLEQYFQIEKKDWKTIDCTTAGDVLTGLVIVSDWIASGGIFSGLTVHDNPDDVTLHSMVKTAVKDAGFSRIAIKTSMTFESMFSFSPRLEQKMVFDEVTVPGVYILEAPMGIGKTEAALFAAWNMLAQKKSNGIYFALPTQLTSDKIYERVCAFLEKIVAEDASVVPVKLLHGNAWLSQKTMGEEGAAGGSWFDGAKRGILAPFAVGTIDQALMAVMNVKHGFVRTFGLAGKTVILDEVHSYDTYTGTILQELVHRLAEIGCTVIILSATLSAGQKREILGMEKDVPLSNAYPLITSSIRGTKTKIREIPIPVDTSARVELMHFRNDDDAMERVLEKAVDGELILWIENTVGDAQKIYQRLASRCAGLGIPCGLLHSRFTRNDRTLKEAKWVSAYGHSNAEFRGKSGRILVGTQVLEQSLDIDADFLVTRLCPTDMLLQRCGRLWRHTDTVRPKNASRQMAILCAEYQNAFFGGVPYGSSAFVYSEYVLCRTHEIWDSLTSIMLPRDIRSLIENTYSERREEGFLLKYKNDLSVQKEKLKRLASLGLSSTILTMPESKAQTRYSDTESVDVLLLRGFILDETEIKLTFLSDEEPVLSMPLRCISSGQKKYIAATILQNCVKVREKDAPIADSYLKYFSPYMYTGIEKDEQPFRVAIVGADDQIRAIGGNVCNEHALWYNQNTGYKTEKRSKK